MDDRGFSNAIEKDYTRIVKMANDRYSGRGYVKPVYPIYEVLAMFTGQQLVRGALRFGFVLRRFRDVSGKVVLKARGSVYSPDRATRWPKSWTGS